MEPAHAPVHDRGLAWRIPAAFFAVVAIATLTATVSRELGVSFDGYVVATLVVAFGALAAWWVIGRPSGSDRAMSVRDAASDRRWLGVLFGFAAVCAVLAMAADRPDPDDYYYVPNAVWAVENPGEPMGYDVHFLDFGPECAVEARSWGTSWTYEYLQAGVARTSSLDFLTVYYRVFPAVVGFVIPLALFSMLSCFEPRRSRAVMGVMVVVATLALLGEAHRSPGNLLLTRAFQGKTVMLAAGLPFFVAVSLRYFDRPGLRAWLSCVVVATACAGLSASAIPVLGALALGLAVARAVGLRHQGAAVDGPELLVYFASLLPLGAYGLWLLVTEGEVLGPDSPVNAAWPETFSGQFDLLRDGGAPWSAYVFGGALVLVWLLAERRVAVMLTAWTAALAVVFLNPITAPLVIEHLTSPNAYWRLFYALPVAAAIGVAAMAVIGRLESEPASRRGLAGLAAVLLLVGLYVMPNSPASLQQASWSWPSAPTVPAEDYDLARSVDLAAPEGVMLAPPGVSGVVPMLGADRPQLLVRTDGVRVWLGGCGRADSAEARIGASLLAGGDLTRVADFERVLRAEGSNLTSVVVRTEVLDEPAVVSVLEDTGFAEAASPLVGGYSLFVRS